MTIGLPENTAVISFYDPKNRRNVKDYAPIDYGDACAELFMVAVHDIDIEILKDYGLIFDTYFPEADDLARFILRAEETEKDIICQCDYGQSRSAACAAAIREFFHRDGIKIFADYRYYPNQLIFNKMMDALVKIKKEEN